MKEKQIHKELLIRVCAVWLFVTENNGDGKQDGTRIKFWSQVLECKEFTLRKTIEKVRYINNSKTGTKHEDEFLRVIYSELQHLSMDSIKKVFSTLRK